SAKPGVSSTADGGSVRLEADRDAACVNYVVGDLAPGVSYDISFQYRTLSTGQARWCLWMDGIDRCANDEQLLTPTPSWAVLSHRAEIPEGATGVRLFVYADGRPERGEPTINEYRRPSVRASTPSTVTVTSASISNEDGAAPKQATLLVAHGGGDRWRLAVRGLGSPFVLALPDAMDAGWGLQGLPRGATAQAMTVDGYRQAWLISDLRGDAQLTARYAPAGAARASRWGAMALVAAMTLPLRRIRRLRRREASPATWTRELALGVIRAARWLLRGTFVQRLGITTWCYRRVARLAAGSQRNIPVTFRGLDLLAPAADVTITPTLATGDYERTAIDAFIRLVPTGGTVVDVGANIGVLSLLAARAVGPRGTVFAFEPIRQNRDLASSNAARNGIANIRMIDKAVGDTEGLLTLYRSEADCGTHSAGLASGTPERVEVVRLEDWVSREGLTSIAALKIDVEGFDGFVLDGARRLVIAWRPVILIEYVPRQLAACGDDPDRVARMLLRLPGTCFAVDERRRQLVPVTTVKELRSALGAAGGNVLIAPATDLLDDLIHPV
ncbi:MAG: FkbM family methyltransferase, partial [Microthrixaceae bacterium]